MFRPTLIALTLAALPAAAQVSPPSDPPPVTPDTMQKVEVKADANSYDPRRDDTASRIVVSNEEIKRYGDTSVLDVFKRLPGITVGGGGGRGAGEIRMRGLGGGYTQILINGERAPAGFDIDQLSPDVIERIEILRAASAEFSTQSIAGTINIVLKRVVRKAQRELRVGYGKSEDASNPSASLNMSDRLDGLSYSLGASVWRYNFDRPQPYEETQVDPEGRLTQLRRTEQTDSGSPRGFNLTPRLNWTLENGDTVSWQTMVSYNRNDYQGDAVTTTELGAPPPYDVRDMNSEGNYTMLRTDVNWVHNLEEGAKLDLKLGANGTRNRGDWREFDYNLDRLARDSTVLSATDERGLTSVGKFTTPWKKDHALSMGWDAGYTQRDDERGEIEVFPLAGRELISNEEYDATIKRLALYIQDEWNVSKQWSMYAGLRWEGLETTSEGNTFETSTNRASVFSPLAQTLYKIPDSRDQVRLALTRTFKAPSASNLIPRRFTTPNNSQTEPDYRGNPDLQPELATGIDAAYEHWWAEKALLSASVSVRRIEDYTRQGLILEDGRWIQTPVNDGDALTRSLELEAKFPLSAVMANWLTTVPEIDLRASVSRNWSEVDAVPGPDNRLDQQVPLSATLGIDYKTRDGKLSTGASFAFKDGGPVRVNVEQSRYQSVRRDLDVYALWKFNPKYQLRLAASNLLRQDGVSDSRYTDEFGTLRRTSFSEGHTMARVTLESRF